jgi:hypothetical protein
LQNVKTTNEYETFWKEKGLLFQYFSKMSLMSL